MRKSFGLQKGDTITLKEKYEDQTYTFTVTGTYPYEAGLTVFMTRDHLNEVFDLGVTCLAVFQQTRRLPGIE